MVEIISKRDGPRREDVQLKRLIDSNRSTIVKLADQLSGGAYSASKVPKKAPVAEGLMIHVGGGRPVAQEAKPSVRVTFNGRVIALDENTGRQLHHIGEVRKRDGHLVFVLATKANGFFAPVDDALAEALAELDGVRLDATRTEKQLAVEIAAKLGLDRQA